MLCGIDPLLRGELLHLLDDMGHSDTVVVADGNFPAHRVARRVVDVCCDSAPRVLEAVRTVLPLDTGRSVRLMSAGTEHLLDVQAELVAAARCDEDTVELLGRQAFYEAAAQAYLVVRTNETRPYGNALLAKGVVPAPVTA